MCWQAVDEEHLLLGDALFENNPIDMPLGLLFGKPPRMIRDVHHLTFRHPQLRVEGIDPQKALERVLRLPTVANKTFLVTIGDRSITGMVARDQMVGPWQVPVADVAVTIADYEGHAGEAMAMGERTPLALVNAPASGRMAIGEAITNIMAASIDALGKVKLSANWMAAAGHPGEDARLYDTVKAVGMELCPRLGIAIPVGKDSMSMKSVWEHDGRQREMTARDGLLLALHDRSDGGLITTLLEMAFAGRCGLEIDITALDENDLATLFSEELGVVLQTVTTCSRRWRTPGSASTVSCWAPRGTMTGSWCGPREPWCWTAAGPNCSGSGRRPRTACSR